jgi:hypothetical protein
MREVSASRFVRATPAAVERALTPGALVKYEGSFTVYEVEDTAARDHWRRSKPRSRTNQATKAPA